VLWFRLNSATFLDERVLGLKAAEELMFYRSIMYSAMTDSDGHIPAAALPMIMRGVSRWKTRSVQRLLSTGLWSVVGGASEVSSDVVAGVVRSASEVSSDVVAGVVGGVVGGYVITNYGRYNANAQNPPEEPDKLRKQAFRGATKAKAAPPDSPRARERGSAREVQQTHNQGPDRTLSGPVRSGPAPAVPRSAGGAARPDASPVPAEVVSSDEDGETSAAEKARKEIRETISKSKMFTGRASPLGRSEWLPNREPSRFNGVMSAMDEEIERRKAAESEDDPDE
jgi:hypothetical protein